MSDKDIDIKISRFWEKYIAKSKRYNIPAKSVRWYVRHAEMYIKSHSSRLSGQSSETMDDYLLAKGRNFYLKDYQYLQLIDALKILFVDAVMADWALCYPWDGVKERSRSLEKSHSTIAKVPLYDGPVENVATDLTVL